MTSQKPSVLLISMTVFLSSNLLADSSLKTHYIVNASGGLTGYASEYVIETGLKGPMIQTKTVDVTEKSVVDEIIDMEQETVLRSVNNSAGVSQTFEDRSDEIYGLSKSVFETTDDPLPVDLGSCKWSADRISAKDFDESKRIRRIKSYRHEISSVQTCRDRNSSQTCTFTWSLEAWLAGKRIPELEEAHDSFNLLADKLNTPLWMSRFPEKAQQLIAMFPDKWEMMFERMEQFGGTPLEMDLSLDVTAQNCLSKLEKNSVWRDTGLVMVSAGGQAAGSAIGSEASSAMGGSVGGEIGGSIVGAAAGSIFSGMTKPAPKQKTPSILALFHIKATLEEWSDDPVDIQNLETAVTEENEVDD